MWWHPNQAQRTANPSEGGDAKPRVPTGPPSYLPLHNARMRERVSKARERWCWSQGDAEAGQVPTRDALTRGISDQGNRVRSTGFTQSVQGQKALGGHAPVLCSEPTMSGWWNDQPCDPHEWAIRPRSHMTSYRTLQRTSRANRKSEVSPACRSIRSKRSEFPGLSEGRWTSGSHS